MDSFDAINLQLIAAVGELRMAAVCLPSDAEKAEPIRRYLLATERRIIEAHKAASAAAIACSAKSAPHGPGTLGVLLAAETADAEVVCEAISAITGHDSGNDEPVPHHGGDIVLTKATLAALVRALVGAR